MLELRIKMNKSVTEQMVCTWRWRKGSLKKTNKQKLITNQKAWKTAVPYAKTQFKSDYY